MGKKLKPCPFCGAIPDFEYVIGTFFEYQCDCGLSQIQVQICDLMTLKERIKNPFDQKTLKYSDEFIERANEYATEKWNTRSLEDELLEAMKAALPLIKCETNEHSSIIDMCGKAIQKAEGAGK